MGNSTIDIMRASALENLYAGCVMPWDKQILEDMPLPADMVDPFASEEVKPLSVMNLTYVSLSGWIAEAKKASYYSERFVYLSKLVQKGVTTMGRGLVTLHKRGEDLSAAPMQIDDLISVGSYHFRKSYLGVVQFSSKHPEIGERLLVNQLGWADLLMRLYKTKEKLAKPISNEEVRRKNEEKQVSGSRRQVSEKESEDKENEKERLEHEEAANDEADESSFLPLHSSLDEDSSLEDDSSLLISHSSLNDDVPPYLVILQQVFARSGPEDEGKLTFTEDEIRLLASDPDFSRIYPEAAADMRRILQQIDSG